MRTLGDLAAHYVAACGFPISWAARQHRLLQHCQQLGQLERHSVCDFVAWLRCYPRGALWIETGALEAIIEAGPTFTHGPVLVIVAAHSETPGWVYRTISRLRRQPGLEVVMGNRRAQRLRVHRVRPGQVRHAA